MAKQNTMPEAKSEVRPVDQARAQRPISEREKLMRNPNLNQAGNERGSEDQTLGAQTGADLDE